MSLTITAASAAGQNQAVATPPPPAATPANASASKVAAAAQPSTASSAASSAQQLAALNRMLATYARDQSHGSDPATLSALGKQIMASAKALGQHVTLPRAPANAGQGSATPAPSESGKVNVTA